jgi:hypothetical protein
LVACISDELTLSGTVRASSQKGGFSLNPIRGCEVMSGLTVVDIVFGFRQFSTSKVSIEPSAPQNLRLQVAEKSALQEDD